MPGNWTDDARNDEGPRRPPRPHHAHPVPQLRRRRGRREHVQQQDRAAGRVRQRAPERHDRRRPGAVRRDDQHDRRRPARLLPVEHLQGQVVQQRHRNGSRLRHRADQVPQQVARPLAAMGHRAGVVPAGRRSVAGRDEHRPSQRRLVPGLSADHSPADGPHLPRRTCSRSVPQKFAERSHAGRSGPRIHAQRNRHHHPRRPGAESWASSTKATSARAPMPTSRSTRRTRTRRRCSSCRGW